jgi:formylglycine-generating enzyme required for sulfatase activity
MRYTVIIVGLVNLLLLMGCSKSTDSSNDQAETDYREMVFVEGGSYLMGSPDSVGYDIEHPQHPVTVSSFYIGKYEVILSDFIATTGIVPPYGNNEHPPASPASYVFWNYAAQYCNIRSEEEGLEPCYDLTHSWSSICDYSKNGYRLPTEAEWEFAARGGNLSHGYMYSGGNNLDEVAWTRNNALSPQPVGTKLPNELGLYDMTGNVAEWCNDWFSRSYYQTCLDQGMVYDPQGVSTNDQGDRFVRGSNFLNDDYLAQARITYRQGVTSWFTSSGTEGFRVARNADH